MDYVEEKKKDIFFVWVLFRFYDVINLFCWFFATIVNQKRDIFSETLSILIKNNFFPQVLTNSDLTKNDQYQILGKKSGELSKKIV